MAEAYTEAFTEVLLRQQAEVAEIEAKLRAAQGGLAQSTAAFTAALQADAAAASRWPGYAQPYAAAAHPIYANPAPSHPSLPSGYGALPPKSGPVAAAQPLAWPRPPPAGLKASPDNVLVERRRTLGDREFRLWVEDLTDRGGIRIYAMDTVSFTKIHTDIKDADIQSMFNQYWWKLSRKRSGDHSQQLTDFLGTLLDSAYLELGTELELRIPQAVEPPRSQAEAGGGWTFLSKGWIRDNILSGSRPSSASRPNACKPQQRRHTAGETRRPVRPQSACSSRPQRSRPQSAREFHAWEPLRSTSSRPSSAKTVASSQQSGASGPVPPGPDVTQRPPAQDADPAGCVILPPKRPGSARTSRPASARCPRRVSVEGAVAPGEEVFARLNAAHTFASISRFPGRCAQ